MESINLNSAIKDLAAKYQLAKIANITSFENSITVECNKGSFNFFSDFSREECGETDVPLFSWRNQRRYQEMRNNLQDGIVEDPVGMRIKHIAPWGTALVNVFVQEVDLAQWILGEEIERVFASISHEYCNAIFSTEEGIKISAELGAAQTKTPILLHEIIAKTGVITDTAVDTQVEHYPIYLYNSKGTTIYNDVDFELYGLSYDEIAKVRFIASVLAEPKLVQALQNSYQQAKKVYKAAVSAAEKLENTAVLRGA